MLNKWGTKLICLVIITFQLWELFIPISQSVSEQILLRANNDLIPAALWHNETRARASSLTKQQNDNSVASIAHERSIFWLIKILIPQQWVGEVRHNNPCDIVGTSQDLDNYGKMN